jgi:uncharacterized protein
VSIHIIIDGYNLIRQSSDLDRLDRMEMQLGRETLVDMLAAYKRMRRHRITVVFDGANSPTFSRGKDRVKGIEIIFSARGELADTVIKKMASLEREKALVVTSDRDIVDYVESCGGASISSPEFENRLTMATYLEIKGVENEEETGWIPTTKKKGPRKRLPKNARRNRNIIRKL